MLSRGVFEIFSKAVYFCCTCVAKNGCFVENLEMFARQPKMMIIKKIHLSEDYNVAWTFLPKINIFRDMLKYDFSPIFTHFHPKHGHTYMWISRKICTCGKMSADNVVVFRKVDLLIYNIFGCLMAFSIFSPNSTILTS